MNTHHFRKCLTLLRSGDYNVTAQNPLCVLCCFTKTTTPLYSLTFEETFLTYQLWFRCYGFVLKSRPVRSLRVNNNMQNYLQPLQSVLLWMKKKKLEITWTSPRLWLIIVKVKVAFIYYCHNTFISFKIKAVLHFSYTPQAALHAPAHVA